jgi:hypothetical protein
LLFASHVGHNVIRKEEKKAKIWSKKWYLKRNVSCDAHLLNELLETDDAIVVPVGKLRKLWDYLSELRSSVCERRLERTVLMPAILPFQSAQFTQLFPLCMTSHIKSLSLTESVYGTLHLFYVYFRFLLCSALHIENQHEAMEANGPDC